MYVVANSFVGLVRLMFSLPEVTGEKLAFTLARDREVELVTIRVLSEHSSSQSGGYFLSRSSQG